MSKKQSVSTVKIQKTLRKYRAALVSRIRQLIRPHSLVSGIDEKDDSLVLVYLAKEGSWKAKYLNEKINAVTGISQKGFITGYNFDMTTIPFKTVAVEDLIVFLRLLEKFDFVKGASL